MYEIEKACLNEYALPYELIHQEKVESNVNESCLYMSLLDN